MQAIKAFLVANRVAVIIAAGVLVVALVAFSFLIALNAVFTVALFLMVVGATIGAYRTLNKAPIPWSETLKRGRLLTAALIGVVSIGLVIQVIPIG